MANPYLLGPNQFPVTASNTGQFGTPFGDPFGQFSPDIYHQAGYTGPANWANNVPGNQAEQGFAPTYDPGVAPWAQQQGWQVAYNNDPANNMLQLLDPQGKVLAQNGQINDSGFFNAGVAGLLGAGLAAGAGAGAGATEGGFAANTAGGGTAGAAGDFGAGTYGAGAGTGAVGGGVGAGAVGGAAAGGGLSTLGQVAQIAPVAAGLLGGGGGGSVGTQTSGPPEWMRPYMEKYLQQAQGVAATPYTPYGGSTVAQLDPYQTAGINATAARAQAGSPLNAAAGAELQKTLGGDYLSQGNPYLTEIINKSLGDVTRHYNNVIRPQQDAMMSRSGSFGNSGAQSAINDQVRGLGETLGGISSNLRYQDYGNERARMQGAIGLAPTIAGQDYVDTNALFGAGQQLQSQNQLNLADAYKRFQEQQAYPQKQLDILGKSLGLGGQTPGSTSTTSTESNPWAQLVGGGLTAASLWGLGKQNGWWGGP